MIEVTRSYAAGKDFWITELQGGHANEELRRSAPMRGREIRMWNWMAVAAGAKGIIYWTYLTEGTGREASGFGLVARNETRPSARKKRPKPTASSRRDGAG